MSQRNQDRPERDASARSQFCTTHWSAVLEAAKPEEPGAIESFAQLYRDYWYPLYAYVRRRGRNPTEAEELTQDFFVTLLTRERLRSVEKAGGKFRSFLLKALQNFLANEWDRATAVKRGSGLPAISLEQIEGESRFLGDCSTLPPEAEFERAWAVMVIENATRNLEAEMRRVGKDGLLTKLRPYLQGDRNGRPYSELAPELGMSEGAVRLAVHRMRQRYGELLRDELARTVGAHGDIAEELRYLIEIVSR